MNGGEGHVVMLSSVLNSERAIRVNIEDTGAGCCEITQGDGGMDEEERGERALAILPEEFGGGRVRRVRHDGEWWFAMEDVAAALTEGPDPAGAWYRLKKQELAACGVDLSELCRWLEMEPVSVTSAQGLKVEAATLEGIFRIVQAIFSPKAEIFKRWLARVAAEPATPRGYRTDLDTVFALLEDAATAVIANRLDDQGGASGRDSEDAARTAARIAGKARGRLEQERGSKPRKKVKA